MRPYALLSILLALALAGCGGDDKGGRAGSSDIAPSAAAESNATPPKKESKPVKPTEKLDPDKTYTIEMKTSKGTFAFRIDQKAAPEAGASFVALARDGFFEGTFFHRIVPGFVIQGGDPTGTGTGGPGYKTVDTPPRDARYTKGVVAMAKAGNEAPGTAGSQFFVVTGDDVGLPPEYAVLGKVTSGIDVVEAIGELGDPASGGQGTPSERVTIEKATVEEG